MYTHSNTLAAMKYIFISAFVRYRSFSVSRFDSPLFTAPVRNEESFNFIKISTRRRYQNRATFLIYAQPKVANTKKKKKNRRGKASSQSLSRVETSRRAERRGRQRNGTLRYRWRGCMGSPLHLPPRFPLLYFIHPLLNCGSSRVSPRQTLPPFLPSISSCSHAPQIPYQFAF